MKTPISITAISSISPLGVDPKTIWSNYQNQEHCISHKTFNNTSALTAALTAELTKAGQQQIELLRQENSKYKSLDNSVLYAMYAAREAVKFAGWSSDDNFGINIGSSRGATELFETYYSEFSKNNQSHPLSSPTTTLGNISSWVAHDLNSKGPEISHSITCSTALHAMLNGIAWINSGMSDKFLVGGSEASLTSFTVAQMQALKIYAQQEKHEDHYPCQALNLDKKQNTMILGEAAAMACLEQGKLDNALAVIKGFGYATELLEHNASLSTDAVCFQKSMEMALDGFDKNNIDIIVTHTPGTISGDLAEFKAIEKVFCNKIPSLTTNKWKVGHSLGASGLLSIEMAILMLQHQTFIPVPFIKNEQPNRIQNILVNAVGFGGNAVSILLSK
ncbi:beta-ketoacyl synthase N-terminal-like domain-containing protein [Winogradskyella sp. 3972H.M.0a.05]|uniref:beta-ketoacyl synthase N-terminal-like domain-containing protein n=1 Tax=Winogradskyella sp. 3972H.M.0a.05 TaxID=2950277 RepID=UPI003397A4DD